MTARQLKLLEQKKVIVEANALAMHRANKLPLGKEFSLKDLFSHDEWNGFGMRVRALGRAFRKSYEFYGIRSRKLPNKTTLYTVK